jgi:hypothetical protein
MTKTEEKSMDYEAELKRVFRTSVIISWALVASLLVYALMVELIRSQLRPFPGIAVSGLPRQTLRYLAFGAAIGAALLVRFARQALLKARPGEDLRLLTSRLSRASVITSSLGELPAVFGFILFLLTGLSLDFYALLFVSLFLEFMYFPRLAAWQELTRQCFPQQSIKESR